MTDREKQIEEIRNILPSNELIKATYDDIDYPRYLYDHNCRIIPEGAVVLTKEEMKHPTRTEVIEFFVNHNAQVRKETASKILVELYNMRDYYGESRKYEIRIGEEGLKELAKQYGVDLEE